MSSFGSSLNIGTSAIHAAQRGLDVSGQNIANAATPGYTRQRVDLESIGGPGMPAFWSRYDGVGEGVKITGVTRMNDEFLSARARNANAALGSAEEQAKTFAAVERTVGEPSDTGLQKKLDLFWNSWGKISTDPRAEAPRNLTFENAGAVANQLNLMSNSMATQYQDTHSELTANVTKVNELATNVAKLNEAIRSNNIAKVPANELLDQRDTMIAEIARLTGATVRPAAVDQGADFASQAVDVFIGDNKLVDGVNANALAVDGPSTNPTGAEDQVKVVWAPGSGAGSDAVVENTRLIGGASATGSLSGMLKGLNETVPNYIKQFDDIAAKLATAVNGQLGSGFTVDGTSGAGLPLFEAAGGGPAVTAANIRVTAGMTPNELAVSKGNPLGAPPAFDGDNAMAMAALSRTANGANSTYASMVVQLGVQANSVNNAVTTQGNVVRQAEDARDNVSGVSLNEEMTNLIKFQHSFSAAAKFIGVIDQTLDTLIHMTR